MQNEYIDYFEKKHSKELKFPTFRPGDTVRVTYRIAEGGDSKKGGDKKKFRLQPFEGVVIRRHRGTSGATFTVRKIGANGIGVERVFPYHSNNIENIELISAGVVRQSRIYYLRNLFGKAARIKSRYDSKKKS